VNKRHYTIHAKSSGNDLEDIGQELDSWQAAMTEANELWPGCVWDREGAVTVLSRDGSAVAEIREVTE
jgi:hypothetical protein